MSTLLASTIRTPVRLDLFAPPERSYVPLQLPLPWRSLCPTPYVSIATYARVSSDEQRDRHTVRNQRSALSRRLSSEPGLLLSSSITRTMASRALSLSKTGRLAAPLVRDARARRFSQIWVVRADRLGRDAFELLRIWRVFESIGVALRATDENIDDPFYFDIHAVIAANERRKFLERSAEGMNRAAQRRPLYRRHRPARLLRSQAIEVSAASSLTTLSCGTPYPQPTWSGASITIWPSTAGPVRVSPPSSTRSASPPPIAATVAASEVVAPRASGAPGISATSSSIPSTRASSSTDDDLPGRMDVLSSLLRFPHWFPMMSGTPPSPPSSATAPCPVTPATPTCFALSYAAPFAA